MEILLATSNASLIIPLFAKASAMRAKTPNLELSLESMGYTERIIKQPTFYALSLLKPKLSTVPVHPLFDR